MTVVMLFARVGVAQELRCGPLGRGRPSADGRHCDCVAPQFVERVVGPYRRCVPRPAAVRVSACEYGQHMSYGHCCANGASWVPDRRACVLFEGEPPALGTQSASPERCPSGTVLIPDGVFVMVRFNDDYDPDGVRDQVRVGAYCIDRTEVSVASYRACVNAGACTAPNPWVDGDHSQGGFCNWGRGEAENHPVNCVDANQADTYCRWQGGRLPSHPEWQYAARGRDGRPWAWGTSRPDGTQANLCGEECVRHLTSDFSGPPGYRDEFAQTAPVESMSAGATPEGVLHMIGNVWEWTSTAAGNGLTMRVGGGWRSSQSSLPSHLGTASQYWDRPHTRSGEIGFRCARSLR